MIGIDIREFSNLKIFHPICEYFILHKIPYNVYYYDMPRGQKEYNRASKQNINTSSPHVILGAKSAKNYSSNKDLLNKLKHDGIKKFVTLEMFLCYSDILGSMRSAGIKTYSILYLTDSMWSMKATAYEQVDYTYFSSEFLMKKALEYSGAKYDTNKHKFLGSPLYDQLSGLGEEDNTLVMLPNIKSEHVSSAFGSSQNFFKIIQNLANSKPNSLIYKTRTKQWMPSEIKKWAKEIIYDDQKMYPSAIVRAFNKCNKIVMFGSSGIYEAVASTKPVINVPIPVSRWSWDQAKLRDYFVLSGLYDYPGAVLNIPQSDILAGTVPFNGFCKQSNTDWVSKYIGNLNYNGAENIAKDVIS